MQWINVESYDPEERLSPYHVLGEFIQNTYAYQNNITAQYVRNNNVRKNLAYLANTLLKPIEDQIGKPLLIYSGFMCNAVYNREGHNWGQLHTIGLAVDFKYPENVPNITEIIHEYRFQELFLFKNFIHLATNYVAYARTFRDCRNMPDPINVYDKLLRHK